MQREIGMLLGLALSASACEGTYRYFPSRTSPLDPADAAGAPDATVEPDATGGTSSDSAPLDSGAAVPSLTEVGVQTDFEPPCDDASGQCPVPCSGCSIDGDCVAAGVLNPTNPCQVCDPELTRGAWSNDDGGSCSDELFCTVGDRCSDGACVGLPRECDDEIACNGESTCDEAAGACSPGQNQCGLIAFCNAETGDCVNTCAGCLINDVCVPSGAEQAGNPCMICDPARSTTSYSTAAGRACGDRPTACSLQDTCSTAGICQPNHREQGAACGDSSQGTCNQPDTCDGNGSCQPRLIANTTSCDDGLFCTAGDQCNGGVCTGAPRVCDDGIGCNGVSQCSEADDRCTPPQDQCGINARCDATARTCVSTCTGCLIGNTCVASGATQAVNPCMICDPARSITAFSIAAGSPCGEGPTTCSLQDTCSAAGVCQPNHLAQGFSCGDVTESICNLPDACDGNGTCQTRVTAARAETCDGVDNDCNGVVDDGLPALEGVTRFIDQGFIDIAPAADGEFRIVATRDGTLSTASLRLNSPVTLTEFKRLGNFFGQALSLAAGGDSFGVLTFSSSRGGVATHFLRLNAEGTLVLDTQGAFPVSPRGLAFRPSAEDWLVIGDSGRTLLPGTFSLDNVFASGLTVLKPPVGQNLAAIDIKVASTANSNSAVVWYDADGRVYLALQNPSLNSSTAEVLAEGGQGPAIATLGSNFAVAWATATGFQFRIVSSAGVPRCNPSTTAVNFGDGVLGLDDEVALTSVTNGSVYVLMVDADGVGLFRMDSQCQLIESSLVSSAATDANTPNIAASGNSLGVAWSEGATSQLPDGAVKVISTSTPICHP